MRLSSLKSLTNMKSAKVSLVVWKIRLRLKSKYSNMNTCFLGRACDFTRAKYQFYDVVKVSSTTYDI